MRLLRAAAAALRANPGVVISTTSNPGRRPFRGRPDRRAPVGRLCWPAPSWLRATLYGADLARRRPARGPTRRAADPRGARRGLRGQTGQADLSGQDLREGRHRHQDSAPRPPKISAVSRPAASRDRAVTRRRGWTSLLGERLHPGRRSPPDADLGRGHWPAGARLNRASLNGRLTAPRPISTTPTSAGARSAGPCSAVCRLRVWTGFDAG